MQRQTTEGLRSCSVSWFRAIGLTLGGILLVVASSHAGAIDASWTAPATTTDGSTLTNLAFYRMYYSPSGPPCPGSTFAKVAAATPTSASNQTISFQLTGLTTGLTSQADACNARELSQAEACDAVIALGDRVLATVGKEKDAFLGTQGSRSFAVERCGPTLLEHKGLVGQERGRAARADPWHHQHPHAAVVFNICGDHAASSDSPRRCTPRPGRTRSSVVARRERGKRRAGQSSSNDDAGALYIWSGARNKTGVGEGVRSTRPA